MTPSHFTQNRKDHIFKMNNVIYYNVIRLSNNWDDTTIYCIAFYSRYVWHSISTKYWITLPKIERTKVFFLVQQSCNPVASCKGSKHMSLWTVAVCLFLCLFLSRHNHMLHNHATSPPMVKYICYSY
jgi:hypothetical protein